MPDGAPPPLAEANSEVRPALRDSLPNGATRGDGPSEARPPRPSEGRKDERVEEVPLERTEEQPPPGVRAEERKPEGGGC